MIFIIIMFVLVPLFVFSIDGLIENKHENNGEKRLRLEQEEYIGVDYSTVKMLIEDQGFTNIELKALNDLEADEADQIDKVYEIMLDGMLRGKGDSSLNNISEYYYPSEKIIIYYHSLKE